MNERRPLLAAAFGLSIALHALVLSLHVAPIDAPRLAPRTPVITARIEPLPEVDAGARALEPGSTSPEPVLKDTLERRAPVSPRPERPPEVPARKRERPTPEPLPPETLSATLERLSETLLYPPEAVRQGLEGEVVVLIALGEGGRIVEASVASSSGYPILDDAALRAVLRLGRLDATAAGRSILLPVRFRLL